MPYEVSFWLKDIIRMYHVNTGNLNSHILKCNIRVYAITDNEQGDLLKYNTEMYLEMKNGMSTGLISII